MNPALTPFPTWMGGSVPPPAQPYMSVPNISQQITNAYRAKNMATAFNVGANAGKVGAADALAGATGALGRVAGPLSIPMALASAHKAFVPMDAPDANISREGSWNISPNKQVDTRAISFTDPKTGALSIPVKDKVMSGKMLPSHGVNTWAPEKSEPPKQEESDVDRIIRSVNGSPTNSVPKSSAMPQAQHDPRAENFVREFAGKADQSFNRAQGIQDEWNNALLKAGSGKTPLSAMLSTALLKKSAEDRADLGVKQAQNNANFGGLGTPAIKEGNESVGDQYKGELKHWLDENSTLNQAHAQHYKTMDRVGKLGLIAKLMSAKTTQGKDYGLTANQHGQLTAKAIEMMQTNPEGSKKLLEALAKYPQAQNTPGGLSSLSFMNQDNTGVING